MDARSCIQFPMAVVELSAICADVNSECFEYRRWQCSVLTTRVCCFIWKYSDSSRLKQHLMTNRMMAYRGKQFTVLEVECDSDVLVDHYRSFLFINPNQETLLCDMSCFSRYLSVSLSISISPIFMSACQLISVHVVYSCGKPF